MKIHETCCLKVLFGAKFENEADFSRKINFTPDIELHSAALAQNKE